MRLLQALTYPECRTAALHLPAHPSPFPAIGKGGGGKGQIRPWLPWERFCAQYGLIFDCRQKSIRIQHSQRQGSWGRAPKRVLVPFTRVKGTPRRRAVLIKFFIKLAPPKVTTNQPRRQAYRLEPFVKLAPPQAECDFWKFLPKGSDLICLNR